MANTSMADLNRDIVAAKVATLELHRLEWLVGGLCTPSRGLRWHVMSPVLEY
jgi:hypothetical protein